MREEHVPVVAEVDRVWLSLQALLALALVIGAYLTMKLRRGWWRPHRSRR